MSVVFMMGLMTEVYVEGLWRRDNCDGLNDCDVPDSIGFCGSLMGLDSLNSGIDLMTVMSQTALMTEMWRGHDAIDVCDDWNVCDANETILIQEKDPKGTTFRTILGSDSNQNKLPYDNVHYIL